MLCFSIINQFIALKKQHVLRIVQHYRKLQEDYDKFVESRETHVGPPALIFTLGADLQILPRVRTPIDQLEHFVFQKISIQDRAIAAMVQLVNAVDAVNHAIGTRNELIDEIRNASPLPVEQLAEIYLGVVTDRGSVDERFGNTVSAVSLYTDDCIFFGKILAGDLLEHGTRLRRKHAWWWSRAPKLSSMDWSKAEKDGLIPGTSGYESWLSGFRKQPTKLEKLRARLARPANAVANGSE